MNEYNPQAHADSIRANLAGTNTDTLDRPEPEKDETASEKEALAALNAKQLFEDQNHVFSSPAGQVVAMWMLELFGTFKNPYARSNDTNLNLRMQKVGLDLLNNVLAYIEVDGEWLDIELTAKARWTAYHPDQPVNVPPPVQADPDELAEAIRSAFGDAPGLRVAFWLVEQARMMDWAYTGDNVTAKNCGRQNTGHLLMEKFQEIDMDGKPLSYRITKLGRWELH